MNYCIRKYFLIELSGKCDAQQREHVIAKHWHCKNCSELGSCYAAMYKSLFIIL